MNALQQLAEKLNQHKIFSPLVNIPVLKIIHSVNIWECITITGSFQKREEWKNGIFENSPYFRIMIGGKGQRFNDGEKMSLKVTAKWTLQAANTRKFSSDNPDKIFEKVLIYIERLMAENQKQS